jgi:hypothetical protein
MKTKIVFLLIGLAAGVALTFLVQWILRPTPTWRTGVFSDMEYLEEPGDVAGTEVHILYGGGFWVLFQEALGEPCTPVLVEADITDDKRITFTVPGHAGTPVTYTGRITPEALVLRASDNGDTPDLTLPRTTGYWE